MNYLKVKFIVFLRKIYISKIRRNKLRKLIKYLIQYQRIKVNYGSVNLFVGLNSSIEHAILFDEYNEKNILVLISYFATKEYNLIDIGANIGVHSLTASKANYKVEILSFEPEPNNFQMLLKNLSLNDSTNIKPFPIGIGNFDGVTQLNINSGCNKGKHSIKVNFGENFENINIPIHKLDGFKEIMPIGYLMIKIDVEGFEKEVIEGALNIIKSRENIILIIELLEEINGFSICNSITELLKSNSFSSIYKITSENTFDPIKKYQGSADYVFLKGEEANNDFNLFNK